MNELESKEMSQEHNYLVLESLVEFCCTTMNLVFIEKFFANDSISL